MTSSAVDLSYDAADNIVYMSCSALVALTTREEMVAHFDRVIAFWRRNAGGRKSYFVVDFDNVDINVSELDFFAEQSKRAHEICAIASVRYGGAPLQRTTARLAGMKNRQRSNICDTREQALAIVRAMKKKSGPPSSK
jgi:hypothetical protein